MISHIVSLYKRINFGSKWSSRWVYVFSKNSIVFKKRDENDFVDMHLGLVFSSPRTTESRKLNSLKCQQCKSLPSLLICYLLWRRKVRIRMLQLIIKSQELVSVQSFTARRHHLGKESILHLYLFLSAYKQLLRAEKITAEKRSCGATLCWLSRNPFHTIKVKRINYLKRFPNENNKSTGVRRNYANWGRTPNKPGD